MHFQTKNQLYWCISKPKFLRLRCISKAKIQKMMHFQSTICLIQYKACTLVMKPNHNCSMPLDFVQWLWAGLHPCWDRESHLVPFLCIRICRDISGLLTNAIFRERSLLSRFHRHGLPRVRSWKVFVWRFANIFWWLHMLMGDSIHYVYQYSGRIFWCLQREFCLMQIFLWVLSSIFAF